ncbi:MAG: hypothetical protein A2Y21_01970 [Clostridiales bacterium GWC2_40_7]|nr:MAG: hypothetical protein A2Y21_01970 [Clostridiales bacterium GWC2_40_7]
MENIKNYVKESLSCRSIDILNDIAGTDKQYKQITRKISDLEDQLTKDLFYSFPADSLYNSS